MAANYQIYRPEWRGWKPGERESFFAAIERHCRAAWRVTLVSVLANLAMAADRRRVRCLDPKRRHTLQ
jgi:hypothetical protein